MSGDEPSHRDVPTIINTTVTKESSLRRLDPGRTRTSTGDYIDNERPGSPNTFVGPPVIGW